MPFQFRFKLSANPIDPQQNASSNLSIQLDQVAPCVVEHFTTQAQLALVANTHAVNPSKRSAKFAIDENTTARLVVELSSIKNELYLDKLDLSFSKPIRLLNIFTTLDQLAALYETPAPTTVSNSIMMTRKIFGSAVPRQRAFPKPLIPPMTRLWKH